MTALNSTSNDPVVNLQEGATEKQKEEESIVKDEQSPSNDSGFAFFMIVAALALSMFLVSQDKKLSSFLETDRLIIGVPRIRYLWTWYASNIAVSYPPVF